jgi:hypothetical protein
MYSAPVLWKANQQEPFADTKSQAVLRQRIDALNSERINPLAEVRPRLWGQAVQQALLQRAEEILIEATEVLFVLPCRGEGFGLPTYSIVSGRCSWDPHESLGILCAIPCVGNESREQ